MQFLARRTSVLSIFMSLVFKFLKIFVLLLCIQGIRRNRCWGDNSTPFVLLDNIENYLTFTPDIKKVKKTNKKKRTHAQVSKIFETNENRNGLSLFNLTINQLSQTLVFIQIFGKSLINVNATNSS